jgi:hypothetical protein
VQNGSYAPGSYGASGYGQYGYDQGGYAQNGYGADGYTQDEYAQDTYVPQPSFQPATGGQTRDHGAPKTRQPRSGPARPGGQRPALGGTKMVLYLVASVVGVIVIVLLVVRLSKSGSNSATGGSTTPPTTSSTAVAPASRFILVQAPKVDHKYPLNLSATRTSTTLAATESAVARALKAAGAGHVTKDVVALYDLVPVTSASNFQAISFIGYQGTFNENAVIAFEQSQLKSSRSVKAGPDGGKMICGYNTSGGAEASECVWVTKDTFGQVQFIVGQAAAKYPGAAALALDVREVVEVPA